MCRNAGMMHAAFILGREGAEEIRSKRKPRKRMVAVKLATGGQTWIEKGRLSEAIEIDD